MTSSSSSNGKTTRSILKESYDDPQKLESWIARRFAELLDKWTNKIYRASIRHEAITRHEGRITITIDVHNRTPKR